MHALIRVGGRPGLGEPTRESLRDQHPSLLKPRPQPDSWLLYLPHPAERQASSGRGGGLGETAPGTEQGAHSPEGGEAGVGGSQAGGDKSLGAERIKGNQTECTGKEARA